MFEDENDVMLGIPSTEKMIDSNKMKNRSKLGGIPIWHDIPSITSFPLCSKCSNEMIFVGQVHAPTTVDRSLYIFCCPSACASQSVGWCVIRNQGKYIEQEQDEEVSVPSQKTPPSTDWGNLCGAEDEDDDLSELLDLLNARDNSLNKKASSDVASPSPLKESHDQVNENTVPQRHFGPIWLHEEYESCFSDERLLDHEEALFKRYLEEKTVESSPDEDSSVLALLRSQQINKNHNLNDDDDSESDEEELRAMMSTRNQIAKIRSDPSQADSASIRKRRKMEQLFQKRMSICPQQVLRYAYGGAPLCSTYMESPFSPPRCPGCHEPRVFEMQLMPTVLAYLSVIANLRKPHESENIGKSSQELTNPIEEKEEIDFGAVEIWSCPNSCQQNYEEVVFVQPSLDH